MSFSSDNETWIIEAGDAVIQKQAAAGAEAGRRKGVRNRGRKKGVRNRIHFGS